MSDMSVTRSQAILVMPVENVNAMLTLHDGERAEVMLFIPAGEDVSRIVRDGEPFVPVVWRGRVCLIARATIACVAVSTRLAGKVDDFEELPCEKQKASIKLRSGSIVEGDLRWIGPRERKRTTDHLNADAPYLVVYGNETIYFVVKAHIAMVTEL